MVPLFGKSVLEHTVELLKKNGVDDICMTLRFLPAAITKFFGDGTDFGVSIRYRIEDEPLGTAGGVGACRDFAGDEDFIVISGDAVCSYDLHACMAEHKRLGGEATLVLSRCTEPTEYGLVITKESGEITAFSEKPARADVATDRVNTGIYFLSPRIFELIPEGEPCDFAADVFPRMLKEGRKLFGIEPEGVWHDIGSPEAYLRCHRDVLDGRLKLSMPRLARAGLYCDSQLPEAVRIMPPCFIGKNVSIAPGAVIGPYTAIGEGSSVGVGAMIERSVLYGASAGSGAEVNGAILCRGSSLGAGSEMRPGSVMGAGSSAGRGCVIGEGVKIWPRCRLGDGELLLEDMRSGYSGGMPRFEAGGVMRSPGGEVFLPQKCMQLGLRCALEAAAVGVSNGEGEYVRVCAESFAAGACSGGADVLRTDAAFPAEAAFAASLHGVPLSVFIRREGEANELWFFGERGGELPRSAERKLENSEGAPRLPSFCGGTARVYGTRSAYISAAVSCAVFPGRREGESPAIAVRGRGEEARTLRAALSELGCAVLDRRSGVPEFSVSEGGFSISAADEDGKYISPEKLTALLVLLEFESGSGDKRAAAPFLAPAVLDEIARARGAQLLRLGRDGQQARQLYERQPWLRHAVFAAARIAGAMAHRGKSLKALCRALPEFYTACREVALYSPQPRVMGSISEKTNGPAADFSHGVTLFPPAGRVNIAPSAAGRSLFIRCEASSPEMAEELCADCEKLVRRADREEK